MLRFLLARLFLIAHMLDRSYSISRKKATTKACWAFHCTDSVFLSDLESGTVTDPFSICKTVKEKGATKALQEN